MARPQDPQDRGPNPWEAGRGARGGRKESRPMRVARTVRDMFTRGPKPQPAGSEYDPQNPVPATPAWLNNPPPPEQTISGMQRGPGNAGGRGGAPNPMRGGPSNPGMRGGPSNPGRGGASNPGRGGPSNPGMRGGPSNPMRGGQSGAVRRGGASGTLGQYAAPPDRAPRRGNLEGADPVTPQPYDSNNAQPRWQAPEWLPSAPPSGSDSSGFPPDEQGQYGSEAGYGGYSGQQGYSEYEAPYGSSGSYDPYAGQAQVYGQDTPAYVPPLTSKVPAAPYSPSSQSWSSPAPASSYQPGANYDPHGGYTSARDASVPASLAHVGIGGQSTHAGEYVPGVNPQPGKESPAWAQIAAAQSSARAPYFWELTTQKGGVPLWAAAVRWLLIVSLFAVSLFSFVYAAFSANGAANLVATTQVPLLSSPTAYKLDYKDVTFLSRTDHVFLSGWFIPGLDAKGAETDARTIIVLHSEGQNREDSSVGLLALDAALAKAGFAVLAFDLRGSGRSQGEPLSMGYFEQRDVLGAVDFLQSGTLPYPSLGRPKMIGGLGFSVGAVSLLLAASKTTALKAVVADSAFADALPLVERDIPAKVSVPSWFTPGVLTAARDMYGIDYTQIRPVDVVANIAPRPLLFIQGAKDTYAPGDDMSTLVSAAQQGSGAQVIQWLVPGAGRDQAYKVAGATYVSKIVAFFTTNLPVKS